MQKVVMIKGMIKIRKLNDPINSSNGKYIIGHRKQVIYCAEIDNDCNCARQHGSANSVAINHATGPIPILEMKLKEKKKKLK